MAAAPNPRSRSLPLGAGTLTRTHLPGDPPKRRDIRDLRAMVGERLVTLARDLELGPGTDLAAATSRTFTQLAVLTGKSGQSLEAGRLGDQIERLARMKAGRRAKLRGVSRPRARQILAGAIVAEAVMTAFKLKTVTICPWAIREGIALELLASLAEPGRPCEIDHLIQPVRHRFLRAVTG